jgi:hypothetical protein
MAQAAAQQIYAGGALFGMKSSRDSLPDKSSLSCAWTNWQNCSLISVRSSRRG